MTDLKISVDDGKEDKKPEMKEVIGAAVEAERVERENERLKRALIEQDELRSKLAVGGRSYAGQSTPEKTPQEKAEEEAAAILKGRM